ncbi:MAG TPA: hypothetical protein VJN18_14525 [Polyangiaceae bacterium]|nr:hypothetical protein [Polyangiaceae bacterium]
MNIYEIRVQATLAELELAVRRFAPAVTSGSPVFLTVGGYDDDPRDLSEIPEVSDLMQRVIDSGLIALLGNNEDAFAEEAEPPPFIDAMRCFFLAKGAMIPTVGGGAVGYGTPAIGQEFDDTLRAAREKIAGLLPTPEGRGDA